VDRRLEQRQPAGRVQLRLAGARDAAHRGGHRAAPRPYGERELGGRYRGFSPSGPGPFASVCTLTGGTGDWAGVNGHIRTQDTFTLAEGGDSDYEGLTSHREP
jgi:hypothetical protein